MIIRKTIGGHYYIISSLGKGGFGETYLAHDEHLPRSHSAAIRPLRGKSRLLSRPRVNCSAIWNYSDRPF